MQIGYPSCAVWTVVALVVPKAGILAGPEELSTRVSVNSKILKVSNCPNGSLAGELLVGRSSQFNNELIEDVGHGYHHITTKADLLKRLRFKPEG
jgi:hypothetical protein